MPNLNQVDPSIDQIYKTKHTRSPATWCLVCLKGLKVSGYYQNVAEFSNPYYKVLNVLILVGSTFCPLYNVVDESCRVCKGVICLCCLQCNDDQSCVV